MTFVECFSFSINVVKMTDIAGYAYGLTVFAGGLIGYIKGNA